MDYFDSIKDKFTGPIRPQDSLLLMEKVIMSIAGELLDRIIEQALAGDIVSQKMLLDRIYPPSKSRTRTFVNMDMSKVETQEDVNRVMSDVLTQVGESKLPIEDASDVMKMVETKGISIQKCIKEELDDIQNQIVALKNNLGVTIN